MAVPKMDFSGFLADLDKMGFFRYVLPFLLIFAVVYGILSKINILGEKDKNKGVNAVISVAIGLLALQWNYVPDFFASIFPMAGVGISILLVALILMGLFGVFDPSKPEGKTFMWIFFAIGAIITIFVVSTSLSSFNWTGGMWWDQYGSALITLGILGALIALVVFGGKGDEKK